MQLIKQEQHYLQKQLTPALIAMQFYLALLATQNMTMTPNAKVRPEQGILGIRKHYNSLQIFAPLLLIQPYNTFCPIKPKKWKALNLSSSVIDWLEFILVKNIPPKMEVLQVMNVRILKKRSKEFPVLHFNMHRKEEIS
jgi:hypothetical protein